MAEVYLYKIDCEYIEKNMDSCMNNLCKWRYDKAVKIKNSEARMETIATGLLFQKIVQEKYNLNKEEIFIEAGEKGKPYFVDHTKRHKEIENVHFNISHSMGYIAIGFSDKELGIDIESKNDTNFRISKRCFTKEEKLDMENCVDEIKMQSFRKIWTMKEAYLKYIGKGISVPLNSFYANSKDNTIIISGDVAAYCYVKEFLDAELSKTYSLCICAEDLCSIEDVIINNVDVLA